MTESIFYVYFGIVGYLTAYFVVGVIATGMWERQVYKKYGEFWEYSLSEGLKLYHPGFWYFVRYRNFLYTVLYVGLWPIMVPWQIRTNTITLRRVMSREYYYKK